MDGARNGNGFGITSLVLGILGLLLSFMGWGAILSILAIIFAVVQRKRFKNGIATAGLVLGIIGVVLGVVMAVLVIGILATYFKPAVTAGGGSSNNVVNRDSGSIEVTAPFFATDSSISEEGESVWMILVNNAGEELTVKSIVTIGNRAMVGTVCEFNEEIVMGPGESESFELKGSTCSFESGDVYNADITIKYVREGSAMELTSTGTIQGTAL